MGPHPEKVSHVVLEEKNVVPCKLVKNMNYTHFISQLGVLLSALVSGVTFGVLKTVCPSCIYPKLLKKFLKIQNGILPHKIVKFASALPCGHPGPEGCCVPS